MPLEDLEKQLDEATKSFREEFQIHTRSFVRYLGANFHFDELTRIRQALTGLLPPNQREAPNHNYWMELTDELADLLLRNFGLALDFLERFINSDDLIKVCGPSKLDSSTQH